MGRSSHITCLDPTYHPSPLPLQKRCRWQIHRGEGHMKRQIKAKQPQAKGLQPPGTGGGKDFPLEPPEGVRPCCHLNFGLVILASDFWLPLQNCRRINFCCIKQPNCGHSLEQVQESETNINTCRDKFLHNYFNVAGNTDACFHSILEGNSQWVELQEFHI